ncbi:MAG TPA: SusC/RagA family TonB-linked outer membrane protein [Gemmatimonadaceae bacterium]|nr:SusC/RagA family TonB-linked outer membrane protein [Gemmatimonadaceae bacterium]
MRLSSLAVGAAALALLTTTATVAAAQGGILTGTVTSAGTSAPLQEARVIVVGTSLVELTGPDGKYTVRRVPAGTAEIRIIRVGYQEQKKSVRVLDGQTATLDFVMSQTIVQLQEVVTTATGEQRRVEVGNAVDNVSVPKLTEESPIRNLGDVLNARVPGVMVQGGGQTGSGQRIRVRGVSSVSLSNDPIYVIDGIRMSANNSSSAFGNGGSNFSRLGDIDPEQIENIEIVKGPSAATLYGTDAANGVIVITTKKGRAGSARWNGFAEGGVIDDTHDYFTNYTLAGHSPTGALLIQAGQCTLPLVASGACIKDSLRTYSPISDPNATPLGLGNRDAAGIQLSAGTDAVRYFVSAGRDNEIGVFQLPKFEQARYDSTGVTAHDWTERPNARLMNSFRGNISSQVNDKFDAQVNFGYTTVTQRTSNESNNTVGIGSQAFGGPGYVDNGLTSIVNTPLHGYRAWTPAYTWEELLQQNVNRSIISSNLNWRPTSWLSTRANVGEDFTDRVDIDLNMNGEGAPISNTQRDGFAQNGRTNIANLSADLGATANYNPSRFTWLNLKTTLGTQYVNTRQDQNTASGTTLPPGAQTAGAGATKGASEATTLSKTLGVFVEQAVAIRDRLFLTGALRTDQNSAFGTNFQQVYYPKGSLSWVMSDESWFPRNSLLSHVSSFRTRLAYGASGVQPGSNTANATFSAASASIRGTDLPYENFSTIGNDSLKPERSTEWETGFDSRLFNSRIEFDLTYFSRLTHDALIGAIVAPSLGVSATSQQQNIGAVKNAGWEITLGGALLDRRNIGIDFNLTSSLIGNKVVSLGNTQTQVGTTNWVKAGYPIRGLFARPILWYKDRNGDGILTWNKDSALTEVYVGSDTVFRGYAEPRYLTSLTSGIDLFGRKLRIQNLLDWRGGNLWYNNTERIRCASRQNCNGLNNPNASLQEQAMVVAAQNVTPQPTLDGFLQPGGFVKWREMSATLQMPNSVLSLTRARTASLVFSARNLHTWTKYRGTDPESDFAVGEGGDSPSEFQTFAQPTYFILRMNLGF